MTEDESRTRDVATPEVLPAARPRPSDDPTRDWFQEIYNQLQGMASQLGLEELRRAALLVDDAYREVYPPQVVRFSTPRGPGERDRALGMLDLALGLEVEGQPGRQAE